MPPSTATAGSGYGPSKIGADVALAQNMKLVQQAQNSQASGQRLADRAAFWLVFVALLSGGPTLAVWLLTGGPVSTAVLFASPGWW